MKNLIHQKILHNLTKLNEWFNLKSSDLEFPIYCSVDIRDAGVKLASVDANIFPAGFNNICEVDQESAVGIFRDYFKKHYGENSIDIMLLVEEHTSNRFYWENVFTLEKLITDSGHKVQVAVPKEFDGTFEIQTPKNRTVKVVSARRNGNGIKTFDGFSPQLVISNNDFSQPYSDWMKGLEIPMNPSHELGWFRRKKSDHFKHYNMLATEFSKVIDVDPWTFTVETQVAQVDFLNSESVRDLAHRAQGFIDQMQKKYQKDSSGCCDPVIFIKNNSGTYGMGIITVKSGEELLTLSQKERKRMGYSKGGASVHEVILQEGIPTQVRADGDIAEPVIYLIGNQLAGGFMRTHKEKGVTENLNSPGAVFKRLCLSDLQVNVEGAVLENVYGWIARLNALAIVFESRDVGSKHYKI